MNLLGAGPGRIPFETHLTNLSESARSVLLELRTFVLSLGPNVIEDVRPHRVVYSKTMNFRIFLDIEPAGDSILLSIRFGKSAPPEAIRLKTAADLAVAKSKVATAYEKIQ